jgi:pyridoxamine 5'-phosphate oxidase family protein
MSVFTRSELEYPRGGGPRRLARIATVGKDGSPHVVPVGFRYEPAHDSIDVHGHDLGRTRKYRDVERTGRAAIVIEGSCRGVSTPPKRDRSTP